MSDYDRTGNRKDEAARLDKLMLENYGKTRTTARQDAATGLEDFAQQIRQIKETRDDTREITRPIQYSEVVHSKQMILDVKAVAPTPQAPSSTQDLPTFNAVYSIGNGDFVEFVVYGYLA